jgi:S-disulfanyl-L-cysteine oxidoreductase SoxD
MMALGALVVATSYSTVRAQAGRTVLDGVFNQAQVTRGQEMYTNVCSTCHGPTLAGDIGPQLAGPRFVPRWKDKTVGDLFDKIKTTMPASAPGTLSPDAVADVLAFILSSNHYAAGAAPMPADAAPLKLVKMADPPGGAVTAAAVPPAAGRPGLLFKEDWKQSAANDEHPVTQLSVGNPNLELKLYGASSKELALTGTPDNPNNPTHVWDGLCTSSCALALRDKANMMDLSRTARVRWVTKVSGFQRIHPVIKLADGTYLAGDLFDGTTTDWHESEFYPSELKWVKVDINRVVTTGSWVEKPDLSKVDEIGWSTFMPASGHGAGGWADVGTIEVYAKAVPR